ncbi:MAG: hypothetical protein Q4G04_00850 [bacterium]|nr:hypothetical protein [bacterium]
MKRIQRAECKDIIGQYLINDEIRIISFYDYLKKFNYQLEYILFTKRYKELISGTNMALYLQPYDENKPSLAFLIKTKKINARQINYEEYNQMIYNVFGTVDNFKNLLLDFLQQSNKHYIKPHYKILTKKTKRPY